MFRAKEAGVVLLNELGLDPGIDHCSAAALIEEARGTGNEVSSQVDQRKLAFVLISSHCRSLFRSSRFAEDFPNLLFLEGLSATSSRGLLVVS